MKEEIKVPMEMLCYNKARYYDLIRHNFPVYEKMWLNEDFEAEKSLIEDMFIG